MPAIPTALGFVTPERLGMTLMHECLCFPYRKQPHLQEAGMAYQVKLLQKAAAAGIHTLCDARPWPDVAKIIAANQQVPQINVILSTGHYLEETAPPEVRSLDEEGMVQRMRKHLTEGFEGYEGKVRAGMIRIASNDQNLTPWERQSFRAAAKVQREFGVPIGVHSCAGAQEQMRYLLEQGADLTKIFFAHVEAEFGWEKRTREQEADYLTEVLKAGGNLLHNNFGFEFDTPWDDLVYLLHEWERRGFGGQILLSVDVNWEFDDDGAIWHEAQRQHAHTGERDYAYMVHKTIPALMKAGITFDKIIKYLVQNPRRILTPAKR